MMTIIPGTPFKVNAYMIMQRLMPYLKTAMDESMDELVKLMRVYSKADTKLGPGKSEWRVELSHDIVKIGTTIIGDALEGSVGLKSPAFYQEVRAWLIDYGSGDKSTKPGWSRSPVHFGPYGRSVWDNDLTHRDPSESTRDIDAPSTWNHIGNQFTEKSLDQLEQYFENIVEKTFRNLPPNIFDGCITQ